MKNQTLELIQSGQKARRRRSLIMTGLLVVLFLLLSSLMLLLGNTVYPIQDVIRVLLGEKVEGATFAIQSVRLPRMIAGAFAGFAFGIAGYVFQTLLRNPLANPNVLGITSGSSAAAVFCIVVLQTSRSVIASAAVLAGLAVVVLMYVLSKGRTFSIGRLILIGIAVQAMLNAVISYLLLMSSQQNIAAALRWLSGSLNGIQLTQLPPLIFAVAVCTPILLLYGKHLQIFELGEEAAASMGVHPDRTRIILIVSSVVLIALATSTTGPIAFVSFLAGPIVVRLIGNGSLNLLPAGLVGANLVLAADLVGQFAFVYRFPVGVITGLLGAPYLIYLLIRMNQKGEM